MNSVNLKRRAWLPQDLLKAQQEAWTSRQQKRIPFLPMFVEALGCSEELRQTRSEFGMAGYPSLPLQSHRMYHIYRFRLEPQLVVVGNSS